MSPSKKDKGIHIHTYKRVKKGKERTDLFMCLDPHCRHYAPAHLLENKAAQCPYCNMEYKLNKEQLRTMTTPHCENCTGKVRRRKNEPKVEPQAKQDLNIIEANSARELINKVEPEPLPQADGLLRLEEKLARLLGK